MPKWCSPSKPHGGLSRWMNETTRNIHRQAAAGSGVTVLPSSRSFKVSVNALASKASFEFHLPSVRRLDQIT